MAKKEYQLTDWLPTTKKEAVLRGWDTLDVVLFSGDAYVDHPSFGVAVIGRLLESMGFRVGIVPQPDWHGDFRDFKKFGRPRLFFGIAPGCMDSMVNKYTAARRLRSEDAYSPDGRHDLRPEYPTIIYTQILKSLYPDVPVVLGGIEASLRRLTHYDYWSDKLRKSILIDSGADLLIYGMGEKPIESLVGLLADADSEIDVRLFRNLLLRHPQQQTAMLLTEKEIPRGIREDDIVLHSHEECLRDKRSQAENFRHIEEESNKYQARRILQRCGERYVVVYPPYQPMSQHDLDRSFDLPYTRQPHPKYKGKRIPAYEMIKFSVNLHRGCFGGCAFCTISAHQGKFITSRSKESILREVKAVTQMPDFKGYLSDLGGPSANMYAMHGKNQDLCHRCARPSCIHPKVCKNLNTDHSALLDIYRSVDDQFRKSEIRKRVDCQPREWPIKSCSRAYEREGAPTDAEAFVLPLLRIQATVRRNQPRPPSSRAIDSIFHQQPSGTMTISSEMWYTGLDPYTLQPVFSAKSADEKQKQRMFFFWYKREERQRIIRELHRIGREDLLKKLGIR